jgi:hypothetical protein
MFFGLGDPRTRHLRKLWRSRVAAHVCTVWAATIGGAAAVAVPYAGLGWLDIGWAGMAGGSIAVAALRWRDYRAIQRAPVPPASPAKPLGQRLAPLVGPALGGLVDRPKRIVVRRTSAAAPAAARLNYASRALAPLLDRLGPHAGDTGREANAAHATLRELAVRISVVEQSLPTAPLGSRDALLTVREGLVQQFTEGVNAYEGLAGAAAECVAALARGGDTLAVTRLTEATEALAGLAQGLIEIKDRNTAFGISG